MFSKTVLGTVLKDQLSEFSALGDSVPRTVFNQALAFKGASAFVVKGVRRCGKSTLLKQVMRARFKDDFFTLILMTSELLALLPRIFRP